MKADILTTTNTPAADPLGAAQLISCRAFGRQCLMTGRLIERGGRAVQLWNGAVVNQNIDCAYKKIKSGGIEQVGVPIRFPSEGW